MSKTRGLRSRFYNKWRNMMSRCYDETNKSYGFYGARGITVSDEWHDFHKFVDDMLPSFKEGLSLDRKDNALGYSKVNCRWVSHKEQCNNRRSNNIVADPKTGQKYNLKQLSEKFMIKERTVRSRFARGNSRFDQLIAKGHLRTYNHQYDPFSQLTRRVVD